MRNVIYVFLYSIAYFLMHKYYLFPNFSYMGYQDNSSLDFLRIIYLAFIVVFPCLSINRAAVLELFFSISYFLLYIPIVVTFHFQYPNGSEFYYFTFILMFSYSLIFIIPNFFKYNKMRFKEFKASNLVVLNLLMSSVILATNFSNFSVVSFEDVYSHRENVRSINPIIGYLILWNTYLVSPLTLILGLLQKNKIAIVVGLSCSLLVYGVNASKIVLFIPFLIIFFYRLRKDLDKVFKRLSIIFSTVIIILILMSQKFFMITAVILMRTFGIAGLLTYQYNEFFNHNPLTYFTHINVINAVFGTYPYGDKPLGVVVSQYFDETSISNSNANFWATDGIASLGFEGIILISILLGLFLGIWKSLTNENNFYLMLLLIVSFSFIVLNVGLFTSLVSGGYLFFIFFLIKKTIK